MSRPRCAYPDCTGDVRGQMLLCAPHWSFLSPKMRLEVIEAHDVLDTQQRAGNVRRLTRDRWYTKREQAVAELRAVRAQLEARGDPPAPLPPLGLAWRRAARLTGMEEQA